MKLTIDAKLIKSEGGVKIYSVVPDGFHVDGYLILFQEKVVGVEFDYCFALDLLESYKVKDTKVITEEDLVDFYGEDTAEEIARYTTPNMNLLVEGKITKEQFVDLHRPEEN